MIFWIVWFIIGIVFAIVFAAVLVPRVMLRTYAATLPVSDRVTERQEGRSCDEIAVQPSRTAREYISSYRITRDETGVFFQGELAEKRAYLLYELVVYGANNAIISILRVKEKFNDGRLTKRVRLPDGTDYCTLRILCADDSPLPAERRAFSLRYALWLALECIVFAIAVDLLLWLSATFALRALENFTMDTNFPPAVWAQLLGYPALAVSVSVAAASLFKFFVIRRRNK